jgi:selenide, water dikinase
VSPVMRDVLFDPQTSGGLLFGCSEKHASEIIKRLGDAGVADCAVIGRVSGDRKEMIQVK